ncbi:HAD family hydrolase [Hyphobacterium sp.]|uniref:sulfotransferase-like domain-containing protein n=1 Tax=Hyphobacterium sp. TaxID=2004662 RepID=UPI003BACB690
MSETIRICLWSGPRNISTATMRSFENRPDCEVWDEPFYGPYLVKTGLEHPGREIILKSVPLDENEIAKHCAGEAPNDAPVFFQKHMCQHMLDDIPRDWMAACRHIFLIRDPAEVAASFAATTGSVTADDIGQIRQAELYEYACQLTGRAWPVIEGRDVLETPEPMLRALCKAIDIPFDAAMMSWPAGKRDSDGVWAPWWYDRVEASTGFEPPQPSPHDLPEDALPAVETSRPHYMALQEHKLTG